MKKTYLRVLLIGLVSAFSACSSSENNNKQQSEGVENSSIPTEDQSMDSSVNAKDTLLNSVPEPVSVCDYMDQSTLSSLFGELSNIDNKSSNGSTTYCAHSFTAKGQNIKVIHSIVSQDVSNDMLEASVRRLDDREAIEIKGIKTYYSAKMNQISFIQAGILHHIAINNMNAEARKIKLTALQLASQLIVVS